MTAKLKGSRLETEVDKCRGECSWLRLNELLPSIRSKNSGIEKLSDLIEGELILETFLERQTGYIRPNKRKVDFLRTAENHLKNAILANTEDSAVVMEAYLLLAKLHYVCENFEEALQDIERSKLDVAKTQFVSLRSLKLAAEGYAVKGFATKYRIKRKAAEGRPQELTRKMLNCFETSTELTISYIAELEKVMYSVPRPIAPSSSTSSTSSTASRTMGLKLGEFLEEALERAPYLSLRKNSTERRWDVDGVEWYRRIMTELSDKTTADKVQQRLCCQLAEILLRGSLESGYDVSSDTSHAINSKAESLNFYTGSKRNYFSPSSRLEEVVLLLLISEMLASRNVKAFRPDEDHLERATSIHNLKLVHNLLVIVLSNLRQYHLLSTIYDRSMWLASSDRYTWFQYALTLACANRLPRAAKMLQHCVSLNANYDENEATEHMLLAKIHIEHLGDASIAIESATKALMKCTGSWLHGRCMLLFALAYSMNVQAEVSFSIRKSMLMESIGNYKLAIEYDPHDELSQLYCALELAMARDLDAAQEYCQQSLELNPEQPSAIMLMALIFTARKDYKSALILVTDCLQEFPNHYGLLVLRLKLESKYGRIEEALNTSKHLLRFWRKIPTAPPAEYCYSDEDSAFHSQANGMDGARTMDTASTLGVKPNNSLLQLNSREALVPVTPMFTAPLGIATSSHLSLSTSVCDMTENSSVLAGNTATLSEYGGAASTVSDSLGILSSSSRSWATFSTFRVQANIWVEIAELFLDLDRIADVQVCVEEACTIFPNSHQALYVKGRLFAIKAKKAMEQEEALSRRFFSEAKGCLMGALAIFPSHIPSLLCLSEVYRAESNLKMAEKTLRDIIATEALHFEAWQRLGRNLAEQERYDEANECFTTANALDTSNPLIPFTVIPKVLKAAI